MRTFRGGALATYLWANGGGTSRRIAGAPPDVSLGSPDLRWQLSLATIEQDGPFSRLDGLDRQFVLLSGRVTLSSTSPAFSRPLGPLEPFAFRGDWPVECALTPAGTPVAGRAAPATALNVITQRSKGWTAQLTVLRPAGTVVLEKPPGAVLLVLVASGRGRVLADGAAAPLDEASDGCLLEGAGYGQVSLTPVGAAPAFVVVRLSSSAPGRPPESPHA